MSTRDQLKKDAIERIVYTAQKMLDGEMHLVEGSRMICKLRMHIDDPGPDDEIYNIFIMVKYETHDLPIFPKPDSKYKALLLRASEKIEEYTQLMRPFILKACQNIIVRLSEQDSLLGKS